MKSYFDVTEDGGAQILQQLIDQRQAIDAKLSGVRHILGVASGKGGVGKSSVCMQLVCALKESLGAKVCVLDLDFNGPSIARLAGLQLQPAVPGQEGLIVPKTADGIGVVSMGTLIPEAEHLEFDNVSSGESYTWRATKEFATLSDILLHTDWGELDYLLLDLPPGPERTFHFAEYFGANLALLLVTAPSELSNGVVLRSLAALEKSKSTVLGYVENMSGYLSPDSGEVLPLFPKSQEVALPIPCVGTIPFEPAFAALCDQGVSLETWSKLALAQSVRGIAEVVEQKLGGKNEVSLCAV